MVLRSQIAVSDCYLQEECKSRCGVSNNNILLSKGPQRHVTKEKENCLPLLTIEYNVMPRQSLTDYTQTHSHAWHFTIVNDDGRREEFTKKLNQNQHSLQSMGRNLKYIHAKISLFSFMNCSLYESQYLSSSRLMSNPVSQPCFMEGVFIGHFNERFHTWTWILHNQVQNLIMLFEDHKLLLFLLSFFLFLDFNEL